MKYKEAMQDIYGYAVNATREDQSAEVILCNVMHDLRGIINNERCFLPRTNGQRKYIDIY